MGGAGCVNRRRRGAPTRFEVSIFYILSTFANELCFFPSRVGVDAGGMGTPSGLSLLRRYSTDEVRHESENAVYSPGSIFTLENLAGGAGKFILMRVVLWAIRLTSCFVYRVPPRVELRRRTIRLARSSRGTAGRAGRHLPRTRPRVSSGAPPRSTPSGGSRRAVTAAPTAFTAHRYLLIPERSSPRACPRR